MACPPPPKPHPNTYWILPGLFLAGEYPGAPNAEEAHSKLGRFLDHGVEAFLDLTHEGELMPYEGILNNLALAKDLDVRYRRMPIQDMGIPTRPHMNDIIDQIETWLTEARTVYVHCWGGIGRTGTVVGCHMVHRGRSGNEALSHLATLWQDVSESKRRRFPVSPQTPAQLDFVRHWHPANEPSRLP